MRLAMSRETALGLVFEKGRRAREGMMVKRRKRRFLPWVLPVVACLLAGCGGRETAAVRVGSLKGPTSMGILFMMERAEAGETRDSYMFRMAVGADELLPLVVKGELDVVLVPANVAAVLYQRTKGGVAVIDVNTLGVLYVVTGTADVDSVADLKGRTIYLTGRGTTPEASLRYLLAANGLKEGDYTLEFKAEAAEVAAVLAEDPSAVGLLPQPFATAALVQNTELRIALDVNREWVRAEEAAGRAGNGMVTGVTLARRDFLEQHPEAVEAFLEEHEKSAAAINEDPEQGAALAVEAGIVAAEAIARKAIPACGITCIRGQEMKDSLAAYLAVLAAFDENLTGGSLPGEDFYYLGNGKPEPEDGEPKNEEAAGEESGNGKPGSEEP